MSSGPLYIVNSPGNGTEYVQPAGYYIIPNSGTSFTVTVKAWSGANGTGTNISAALTAINRNVDTSTDTNSSGGTGTSWTATSSNGTNGSAKFCGAGKVNQSGVGSLTIQITAYTGSPVIPTGITFTPSAGGPGTSVSISGSNFSGATSVTFNGVAASFTVNSNTSITATVPTGATTGVVHVANPSGGSDSAASFTVAQLYVNTGTPASPVWTAAVVYINTGTPAAPVWTVASEVDVNTGTPASPTWTPTS